MSIGTFVTANGTVIPATTESVRTSGYAAAGDGGGAIYSKEGTMPSHPARFQAADGRWFGLDKSQLVCPEMFGAVNPAADATAALQAALDFASSRGSAVRLMRIYLYSSEIQVPAGVRVTGGRGAGLKRIDQVRTTTTSAISAGSGTQSFTVSNSAGFAVGQSIMLISGSTVSPSNTYAHRNPVITAVSGSQITIDPRGAVSAHAAGAIVQTATHGLILAADTIVEGITFDGNFANQAGTDYNWITHNEVTIEGDRAALIACAFQNSPADAVLVSGTATVRQTDSKILGCSFTNIGANAVHYGATRVSLVEGCTFKQTNMRNAGLNAVHQDGAVIYSNDCTDLTVTGCDFDDCLAGLGSLSTYASTEPPVENDNVTVTGCTFRNCRRALDVVVDTRRIVFVGNRVWAQYENGHYLRFDNAAIHVGGVAAGQGPKDILIADNEIFNGNIYLVHCYGGRVGGNHINLRALQEASQLLSTGITLSQCSDVAVCDNTVEGGQIGIAMQNNYAFSDTLARPLLCANNHLIDQKFVAIRGVFGAPATGVKALLQGNQITNSAASSSSAFYNAVTLEPGMFAIGNKIDLSVAVAWGGAAPAANRRNNVVNGAFEP